MWWEFSAAFLTAPLTFIMKNSNQSDPEEFVTQFYGSWTSLLMHTCVVLTLQVMCLQFTDVL